MALYINGMGNISPQQTWDVDTLPLQFVKPDGNRFVAIEPDHAHFIDAKQIRRMSRIIKMGVSAATIALKNAKVKTPEAIITGTAYGCLEDTGTFLAKLIENKEVALNPTPFIQSTHNTIGSQIALLLQCQGYNQTYAHSAISFESVLMDAMMQSEDEPNKVILIGGIDEITEVSHSIQQRFGMFKHRINGEGAASFVVSGSHSNAICSIQSVRTFYKPSAAVLAEDLKGLGSEFDLILSGISGDSTLGQAILDLQRLLSPGVQKINFKDLCGEYPTSSAFALWLAATTLREKQKEIKKVLILNEYFSTYYSAISVVTC
jgi:3-oxoacyl-[acyl-carrier-protein] synthase II